MHIVIAGFGREGRESLDYFLRQGHRVTVVDEKAIVKDSLPADVDSRSGEDVFERLDDLSPDLVIRTAGLAPYKLKTTAKVWSATNEFFQKCPAPIIGVTGSKGKGTTCSLIASILRASGKKVHLLGNIGIPALRELDSIQPQDIVVYELSSFQLWDIEYSPHVAVVLHIEPDHLDVHSSFEDYVGAKSRIVAFQTRNDVCLYHPENSFSEMIARTQHQAETHAAKYGTANNQNTVVTAYDDKKHFLKSDGMKICSVKELQIPGKHNVQNAEAAISACLAIDEGISNETIASGLRNFAGLDHRLKFIDTVDGVEYYDDSIATTPGSTIAAIDSFIEPKVLLVGGSSKGADFTELSHAVADASIRHVFVYGKEMENIASSFKEEGITSYSVESDVTMEQLVEKASSVAEPGDVVVLSPACASFDMFKSYEDRGDQFIQSVKKINRTHNAAT